MFDAARAEGLGLFVADGYRTAETQQQILEGKIEAYKNEGYSSEEAEKKAKEWVAVPGTSEHQLGLAVDINADKSQSTSEEVYEWLSKNAYKYGFIQRYPEDKTDGKRNSRKSPTFLLPFNQYAGTPYPTIFAYPIG